MSNLNNLQRNICESFYHDDQEVSNEAQRIFLEYCEKDGPHYYNAENIARTWMMTRDLLTLAQLTGMYQNAPWAEIKDFFMARLPNLWRLDKQTNNKVESPHG